MRFLLFGETTAFASELRSGKHVYREVPGDNITLLPPISHVARHFPCVVETSVNRRSRGIWTYGSLGGSFTVTWLPRPCRCLMSDESIMFVLVPRLSARSSSPSNPQRHTPVSRSSAFERPGRALLLLVLMTPNLAFGNKS